MKQKNAPGAPGIAAKWTSSAKDGIGKAITAASKVTFTISHGILNEVYFPREDIACMRDMGFLITDGKDFFSEEKRHTEHSIQKLKAGIPAYKVTNIGNQKKYQITKMIITDPIRDTVLQKINFKANGNNSYHLYALLAPHVNNEGNHNSRWVGDYKGIPMLFAQNGDICMAFVCSVTWVKGSVGYVGVQMAGWILAGIKKWSGNI